ncbi:MAG: hypothetical protein LBM56_00070 [Burkholderiaceae bacterium]|jgi:hypothetical protein|nr:hypothetical protein [Burkholderiaceae bacterium]
MELLKKLACVMSAVSLISCGNKKEVPKDAPKKTVAESIKKTPDAGLVEQGEVRAKGVGITPDAAINEALKTVIMQVNGSVVSSASANLNNMSKVTADVDVQKSGGVISGFKVNYVVAPEKAGGVYNVEITAKIAKVKAPG